MLAEVSGHTDSSHESSAACLFPDTDPWAEEPVCLSVLPDACSTGENAKWMISILLQTATAKQNGRTIVQLERTSSGMLSRCWFHLRGVCFRPGCSVRNFGHQKNNRVITGTQGLPWPASFLYVGGTLMPGWKGRLTVRRGTHLGEEGSWGITYDG